MTGRQLATGFLEISFPLAGCCDAARLRDERPADLTARLRPSRQEGKRPMSSTQAMNSAVSTALIPRQRVDEGAVRVVGKQPFEVEVEVAVDASDAGARLQGLGGDLTP